jgi:folate receptor
MWFFSSENPNNAVTQQRVKLGLQPSSYSSIDVCWLAGDNVTKHKAAPTAESAKACHPFQSHACCAASTVKDVATINADYGPTFRWDRCGKLSQECERFFVQESCFYECDPNAGLFRAFPPGVYDANNSTTNTWQLLNMPIQGDYCDAWYEACKDDLFCSLDEGSFFSCSREASEAPVPATPYTDAELAGIIIGSFALFAFFLLLVIMIYYERQNRPIFGKKSGEKEPLIMKGGMGNNNLAGDGGGNNDPTSLNTIGGIDAEKKSGLEQIVSV